MTVAVRLQVHGLNLDDEATFAVLSRFDNATFAEVNGLAFMTVFVEQHQNVVSTVIDAARRLACKIRGARAIRVHPDLVSAADIAQRVGVSREAVRKWTKSQRSAFPMQFDTIGADQRVWRWIDIAEWLLRVKAVDMDEDLPSPADADHIDACLNEVPDVTSITWHEVAVSARYAAPMRIEDNRQAMISPASRPSVDYRLSGSARLEVRDLDLTRAG